MNNVANSVAPILPGATIGVVGGGQLGRYFALAARQLGYNVCVLDPDANAPAMQIASVAIVGKYDDPGGEGHCLDLIVGHVDHRAVWHGFFELGDFDPRCNAKPCIEV